MQYVTATKAVNHGVACEELGFVGVAVKQKAPSASAGTGTPQKQVGIGEDFAIITKGIVQVPYVATAAKGSNITITAAGNVLALTAAGAGVLKFGKVVEIAGQRGTPTGFMRVDLDKKDSF